MITTSFASPELIARETAKILLEIEAVHVAAADAPFTLTSGAKSPVYIDCRKLISFPRVRASLMDFAVSTLATSVGHEAFDGVAGGETAGIPFAAFLSERLALPMQYVRKKPKGFGRNAQIEGHFNEGDRILLVEDLATDGGSKFMFAEALRKAGASCDHVFVIFYYDIFSHARQELADKGLSLHHLASWWDVLAVLKQDDRFDAATTSAVEAFLHDPKGWSKANGGEAS
ncbi:MAG: orotate phosphoribosyltransferase [Candidatus Puniceispirillaceae bacterium]